MLKLIRKQLDNKKVSYLYQPEGKGDVGLISYYFANKEGNRLFCEIMSSVENENFTVYRDHAIQELLKFIKEKKFPEEKIIKWY